MTIKETLEVKRNGTLYDKDYKRKGLRSGRRGDFNNLYLEKVDDGYSIFGYSSWSNRLMEINELRHIDPDQEYCPSSGVWLGGCRYLYLKK